MFIKSREPNNRYTNVLKNILKFMKVLYSLYTLYIISNQNVEQAIEIFHDFSSRNLRAAQPPAFI